MSVVYPVARGSAPVVVLVFSVLALSEEVSAAAVAGVALVALGIFRGLVDFPGHLAREIDLPLRDDAA